MLRPIQITVVPAMGDTEAKICFTLGETNVLDELFTSEDGKHQSLARYNDNQIPIVYQVATWDDRKASVLYDWLEEAIEASLGDQYGDDHFKANLLP